MITLLNTRPSLQAEELNQLLRRENINSINCPSLTINAFFTPPPPPVDYIFFISVNAVVHFLDQLDSIPTYFAGVSVYAVGKATAKELAKYGIVAKSPSAPFNSETVLALLPSNLQSSTCLIAKGLGGLDNLATGLISKNAKVFIVECYKRVASPFCIEAWQEFKLAKHGVVLITSLESIVSLINSIPNEEKYILLQKNAIIFSKRIEDHIISLGWQGSMFITNEQSNGAIIKLLKEMA